MAVLVAMQCPMDLPCLLGSGFGTPNPDRLGKCVCLT